MTKHTPGPWAWAKRPGQSDLLNGRVKVQGYEPYEGLHFATGFPAVDKANAILMSAAPELLAALEGVVRVADRQTDEFDAARAAIAKAKGETPND